MSNQNSHSSTSSLPIWVFLWLGLQLYLVPSVWQSRKGLGFSPNTFPGPWSAVEVLEVWLPFTGKNVGSKTLMPWRRNSVFWIRRQLDGANHWAKQKPWLTNVDKRLQAVGSYRLQGGIRVPQIRHCHTQQCTLNANTLILTHNTLPKAFEHTQIVPSHSHFSIHTRIFHPLTCMHTYLYNNPNKKFTKRFTWANTWTYARHRHTVSLPSPLQRLYSATRATIVVPSALIPSILGPTANMCALSSCAKLGPLHMKKS